MTAYDSGAWARVRAHTGAKMPARVLALLAEAGPMPTTTRIAETLGRYPWDSQVLGAIRGLERAGQVVRVSPEGVRPFVWGLAE